MAFVQSVRGVYMIRFCLGLAEAGFYPGIVFLIGTWYSKKELGKRNSLLTICGALGGGLSGLIQAAFLKTMDGAFGISGWRWMFLFDGSVTALLAFLGYKYLPDYPDNTTWLSDKERGIAKRRLDRASTESKRFQWGSKTGIQSIVANKFFYLLVIGWACVHLSLGAAHVLGIVAKKIGYDAISANLFTTPDMLVTMAVGLVNGFMSDRYRNRMWFILVPSLLALVGSSMLAAFVQPFGLLYFAFILTHAGLGSTTPASQP
ncbi:hypothetical protein DFQ28_008546 [Apophysomyces sp. BC1034]|nr:hypothetical protein DFQ29_007396 [Apophysomyces sp. BC1021]KAG0185939.1 hypothetical protein DFQ28_008546 [Apophysomyces sp. BC1034]